MNRSPKLYRNKITAAWEIMRYVNHTDITLLLIKTNTGTPNYRRADTQEQPCFVFFAGDV